MKKAKSVKRLEFEGEDAGFIFQARKPMTRHARKLMEGGNEVQKPTEIAKSPKEIIDLSSPTVKHTINKLKRGKEKVIEKTEFQRLEENLKLENQEIVVMKKRARKHSVEKVQFKRMKEVWEGQVDYVSETLDNTEQLVKWIIPTIKEAKFVRIIKTHIRANNKRLKYSVKDLQE